MLFDVDRQELAEEEVCLSSRGPVFVCFSRAEADYSLFLVFERVSLNTHSDVSLPVT